SYDAPSEKDDILLTVSSVAERLMIRKVGVFLKVTGKKKHATSEPSNRKTLQKTQKVPSQEGKAT
ncbi:hypothetical protein Tco_1137892, partial [Tanacetum coccineum]